MKLEISTEWDTIPGEAKQAHEGFKIYRSLDPVKRSLRLACYYYFIRKKDLPPSTPPSKVVTTSRENQFHTWSAAHQWVKRVKAYDAYIDREARRAHLEAVKSMRKRQAQQLERTAEMLMIPTQALEARFDAIMKQLSNTRSIKSVDLLYLALKSARSLVDLQQGERKALGVKDISEQHDGITIEQTTFEEITSISMDKESTELTRRLLQRRFRMAGNNS